MFAYFFDEDHEEMPGLFGPRCASSIISVLDGKVECHIFVGGLLHQSLVYRLGEVTHSLPNEETRSWKGGSITQKMVGDIDHFKTVICDLAETLSGPSPTMSENDFLAILGRKNLWVVVAAGIDWDHAVIAHTNSGDFEPYIGFAQLDPANPVHSHLFFDCLFQGKYLSHDGLLFLEDEGGFEPSCAEYGAHLYEILDYDEFHRRVPKLNLPSKSSPRGQLSAKRAAGAPLSHRERVADQLLNAAKHSRDFQFSVSRELGATEFIADERKFLLYLLNSAHPVGGAKAKFFDQVLDIRPDDWRYLADQFIQGAGSGDLYRVAVTQWEYTHGALVRVTGRNGREALVETGWKLQDDGPASLVTAYPYSGEDRSDIKPVVSRVPARDLSGEALYEAIYKLAVASGTVAGKAATPTPMVLEGWGTIWGGECGFAWVDLPSGKTPFTRWLSKQGIGYAKRPGRRVYSSLPTQSIVENRAFADAFAGVLVANGIECSVGSRLD